MEAQLGSGPQGQMGACSCGDEAYLSTRANEWTFILVFLFLNFFCCESGFKQIDSVSHSDH